MTNYWPPQLLTDIHSLYLHQHDSTQDKDSLQSNNQDDFNFIMDSDMSMRDNSHVDMDEDTDNEYNNENSAGTDLNNPIDLTINSPNDAENPIGL